MLNVDFKNLKKVIIRKDIIRKDIIRKSIIINVRIIIIADIINIIGTLIST